MHARVPPAAPAASRACRRDGTRLPTPCAHRENLQLARFAVQLRDCFEPIDLRFLSWLIALRHIRFTAPTTGCLLPPLYVPSHRGFGDCWFRVFLPKPHPDAMRRVPLLARRLPVRFQNAVDCLPQRTHLRTLPFVLLSFRRDRARQRLPHHPPVHAELLR